ncbi:MAG: hypothetical protein IJP98_02375 [Clostridia bacterium]|nr:hypothetical protein [Clostridia bacterium]
MQLKKIAKICAATRTIVTYEHIEEGTGAVRRFVGDKFALYEVGNLGDSITLEIMQTIFDVKKEDRPGWTFVVKPYNPEIAEILADTCEDEVGMSAYGVHLQYRGAVLIPFYGGGKIFFVEETYFAPLRDEIKAGGIGVYWRRNWDVLTVKNGLCQTIACVSAFTLPEDVVEALRGINARVFKDHDGDE